MKPQSTRKSIALIILVLIVAAAASAQPGPGRRGAGRMWMDPADAPNAGYGRGSGLQWLDLDEQQQQAIDKLRQDCREGQLERRKEIMRLRNELDGIMLADAPDSGKARGLIEAIGKLRTESRVERMQQRLEIRKLLTPEQRDRLIARGGRRGGFGRHGYFGRGDDRGYGPCFMDRDADRYDGRRGGRGYRR